MSEYYGHRRFEFYKAGFKTIRLPGAMCSPVFLAAYDIALLCQLPFTPAIRHPDRAAKIAVLGLLLLETPEFSRLKQQTLTRYRMWLESFCYQSGGRFLPTMRYMPLVKAYRAAPTAARLRNHCTEFRRLLREASNERPHKDGYQPRPSLPERPITPTWVPSATIDIMKEGIARLRQPCPAKSSEEIRRRNIRTAIEAVARKRLRLAKPPLHMPN